MRVARLATGVPAEPALAGAVLTRDLVVAGERWHKGRVLSGADLAAVAASPPGTSATVLVPASGDLHEDEAARRLAAAVAGADPGVVLRGPAESRVDLVAAVPGVVAVRLPALERLNRLDPLEVFTVFDGQVVAPGDLVASVKVAPHLVPAAVVAAGEAVARRGGPLVRVRAFRPVPVAVVVTERVGEAARTRFEASVRAKVDGLGARLAGIAYVPSDADAVAGALAAAARGARIVLAAGGASTDPADPFFVALERLGGRVVRRGVPAHPGSMLWLGRLGRAAVVGLPSCGAYSKATAADLLLPRLVAGEPATAATVARLAHGGILARSQRFRFPAYARDLEAPEG